MTSFESPSGNPSPDDDLLAGLDFDMPVEIVDDDGSRWLPIDYDSEKDRLVDALFRYIDQLHALHGDIDMSDPKQYIPYLRNIETLMEPDEAKLDIYIDDLIQFTGLKYIAIDGEAYIIPDGTIIRGRYQGLAPYPTYIPVGTDMTEMLPLGVHVAVTELCAVSSDGEEEVEFDLPDGMHALLSVHGLGVHMHKLEPVVTT